MPVIPVGKSRFLITCLAAAAVWTLFAGPPTAVAQTDPSLAEAQVKEIAAGHGSIGPVIGMHTGMGPHASYNSRNGNWTVTWTNPNNGRVLVEVEVEDAAGAVLLSRIEDEAYFETLPMLEEEEAVILAEGQERVIEELDGRENISNDADIDDEMVWTVSFSDGPDIVAEVLVDDDTGTVTEVRVGPQVAWSMARGYDGAFGRIVNEPYIWLPLCLMFLLPFIEIRRPLRWLHLDLLVLLSFTVSHYFFNQGEIFTSVPLAYPPLVYLFLRIGWMTLRRDRSAVRGDREDGIVVADNIDLYRAPFLNFSPRIMLVGLLLLVIFRITINIADSNVVDVGYSGVIGAQRIAEGVSPYGNMTDDNSNGDTYGPLNYLLYVPFEKVLPWSGDWDALPAAHAAAIFFDLVAMAGMYAAGRRLGGRRKGAHANGHALGLALAYGWAAYPYTTFVMSSNVNDTIVAAFMIWGFVFIMAAPLAGVMLGFATQIKFFPAIAGLLWASYPRAFRGWGQRAIFVIAFIAALAAPLPIIFLGDGGLGVFWERSLEWQTGRDSPFSIWGQYPDSLGTAQRLAQVATVALAVGLYFWPPRKTRQHIAAGTALLLLAFQLVQTYWFYLYIPWFFPFVFVALILCGRRIIPGADTAPGSTLVADITNRSTATFREASHG